MIAAWFPFFKLLRYPRRLPFFDGADAPGGNGAHAPGDDDDSRLRGADEADSDNGSDAENADSHAEGHARSTAGDGEPNGRAADEEAWPEQGGPGPAPAGGPTAAEVRPPGVDEEAFKAELTEHLDSMYRLALSLSKNPRDAEDLTQEATLKALNHWMQYKPGTNMRAWLLAIVRNAFINRYRRQRNRPGSVEFDDVEPFLSDPHAANGEGRHLSVRNIEQLGRLGELLDDEVKKALDELSDDFRETFLLAVVEELSYKDIAQILGVPVGTVMSRLFRARKQMQAKLSSYAHEAGWLQPTEEEAEAAGGDGELDERAPTEAEESGVME